MNTNTEDDETNSFEVALAASCVGTRVIDVHQLPESRLGITKNISHRAMNQFTHTTLAHFSDSENTRLPLQVGSSRSIAKPIMRVMKFRNIAMGMASILALSSCQESTKSIEVTETRKVSSFDEEGNISVVMPADWRRVPSTKFRDYNCKFGEDGEVYLSIASGSIKENAQRWMKQFGSDKEVVVGDLETVEVFGEKAVVIEAAGKFEGMRGSTKDDAALLGLMVETRGNLITVKMVASSTAVELQRDNFFAFCKSLKWK